MTENSRSTSELMECGKKLNAIPKLIDKID